MKRSSRLLIEESPLQVLPSLACAIGLNEAVVAQQLHYWLRTSTHEHDGRIWVYNSYPEWQKQFPWWSIPTIQRIISGLEKRGVILTGHYNRVGFDRTKWYSLNYELLDSLLASCEIESPSYQDDMTIISSCDDHHINMIAPIPETNTETNNRERDAAPPSAQMPYPANPPGIAAGDMDRDPEWEAVGESRAKQIRPGMSVKEHPDAPPVRPVPKASDDAAALTRWQQTKAIYPHQGGHCTNLKGTRLLFLHQPADVQARILTGATHLAQQMADDPTAPYPPSLYNFIDGEDYDDLQTPPVTPPRLRVVKADPPPRPPVTPAVIDPDVLAAYSAPYPRRSQA